MHTTLNSLALLIQTPRTHSQDSRLVQFLDARLWEEDAACGFGFGFYALNKHAVEQRRERFDGFESSRLLDCEYLNLFGGHYARNVMVELGKGKAAPGCSFEACEMAALKSL